MKEELLSLWERVKVLVESTELDLAKHADGNSSAGTRVRRNLRELKKEASSLVKASLESEKERKLKK